MTENEAIKILKRDLKIQQDNRALIDGIEALQVAIQALEEIQQYRAIGTVEQLEWCKDASHWKELFKDKLEQYEAIGTVEEFKALKEKNVAKKPTPIDYEKYIDVVKNAKFLRGAYWCPNCKHTVMSDAYCNHCGQKLDWQ